MYTYVRRDFKEPPITNYTLYLYAIHHVYTRILR